MSVEGKKQIITPYVPANDNPRGYVTENEYIAGAPQVFKNIQELIDFHPAKMKAGMSATILNFPLTGVVSGYRLAVDPEVDVLTDVNGDSIITAETYTEYWIEVENFNTSLSGKGVYEYAPDGPGSGSPIYPYTALEESNWTPVYDPSAGHKWLRIRYDDVDDNSDDIFDNWTRPIPVGQAFATGDYVDIKFRRFAVSEVLHTVQGTMTNGLTYTVISGSIDNTTTGATLTKGTRFVYSSGNTLVFNGGAQTRETVPDIPRLTPAGLPNNDPANWQDPVPGGTDQLFKAEGQKTIYGSLKSEWFIYRVNEDPNYVRYSNVRLPDPNGVIGTTTSAAAATQGDTDLIAAGWVTIYDNQTFIATRRDAGPPGEYTAWVVQKITEESGEYTDTVFKLLPLGLDDQDPLLSPPSTADAIGEGFSDVALQETNTEVNYWSSARKFFDGTLKSAWSPMQQVRGFDAYDDAITSDLGDSFKRDQLGNIMPAVITLTAEAYRGQIELWKEGDVTITYTWKKIYDNGSIVDVDPNGGTFALVPAAGTYLDNQRVTISPDMVTGKAVFQCIQAVTIGGSGTLSFTDSYELLDISDGIDAKSLAVSVDSQLIIWDTFNTQFAPETFTMRAFQSNLVTGNTFYWYRKILGVWTELTAADDFHVFPSGVNGGVLSVNPLNQEDTLSPTDIVIAVPGGGASEANISSALSGMPALSVAQEFYLSGADLDPANEGLWVVDTVNVSLQNYDISRVGTSTHETPIAQGPITATIGYNITKLLITSNAKQAIEYAVSNQQISPDAADYDTHFADFVTITKLASESTGTSGEDAIGILVDNEAHTVVLDNTTNLPFANQEGFTGTASTLLQLYDGSVPKIYNTDYTISVATVSGSSTFSFQADGNNVRVYLNAWNAVDRFAVCEITITYGAYSIPKKFSLSSTLDAPGAIILDIDSNNGFSFTPSNRAPKTITASVYDNGTIDTSPTYEYRWLLNNVEVQVRAVYGAGQTYALTSAEVQGSAYVKCEIYIGASGTVFRERTISIEDITDASGFPLYYTYSSTPGSYPPANPGSPSIIADKATYEGATYSGIGSNSWKRGASSSGLTYWISIGIEQENKTIVFGPAILVKGEKGIQGATGAQGIQGVQGNVGGVGPQGLPGDPGNDGTSYGYNNVTASNGGAGTNTTVRFYGVNTIDRYVTVPPGAQGIQGPIGPVGPQGPRGFTGATGPTGLIDGASLYRHVSVGGFGNVTNNTGRNTLNAGVQQKIYIPGGGLIQFIIDARMFCTSTTSNAYIILRVHYGNDSGFSTQFGSSEDMAVVIGNVSGYAQSVVGIVTMNRAESYYYASMTNQSGATVSLSELRLTAIKRSY